MPIASRRPLQTTRSSGSSAVSNGTSSGKLAGMHPFKRTVHIMDVPFEMRGLAQQAGAAWNPIHKAHVFIGDEKPTGLIPFSSRPYSWERWREDIVNDRQPIASIPKGNILLRPHQKAAADAIVSARSAGLPGFLIADDVGLGKTIEAWSAILRMRDIKTVLIVCPLAVVAHWRRTIEHMGDRGIRVVVINYERMKKLFDVPKDINSAPAKSRSKSRKTSRKVKTQKGVARYGKATEFDLVLFDESQKLRNLTTARSGFARKLSDAAKFVLWLSATAGQDPLELAYLSRILAASTGCRVTDLKDYEKWCRSQGIGVTRGAFGKWIWSGHSDKPDDRERGQQDLELIRSILFDGNTPVGIRRTPTDIEGWPAVNRILLPVDLTAEDRVNYQKAWNEFRRDLELSRSMAAARSSNNALVARLRFRQKSSLLRTEPTVNLALDLLEQGQQVAISVQFKETLNILRDAISDAGYAVAEIHGDLSPGDKERQRLDFQHGRSTVCIYTVEEGISLHEGEHNDARRSNIIHDLRWSAIQMKQIEGRTHRDGKFSQVYWMMGAETVEEDVALIVTSRMKSMSAMQGDADTVRAIDHMLSEVDTKKAA